jgi:D-alanyl-D-alanine carboxypeptidase
MVNRVRRRVVASPLALALCSANAGSIASLAQASGAPGALVGIQEDGAKPQLHVWGLADPESKEPMTSQMHMRLGSVSKLFAGSVALRLADAGHLDLAAPVRSMLTDLPLAPDITVAMLGAHTSGLDDLIRQRAFQAELNANPRHHWDSKELISRALRLAPRAAPGARVLYSNLNTILLAAACERATGMAWPELLKRWVFEPCGLNDVAITEPTGLPAPSPKGYRYARAHWPIGYGETWIDATQFSASWTGAAGNLHATVSDLIRAVQPLCSGALLSPGAKARLHAWRHSEWAGEQAGFHVFNIAGCIGHAGDVPGFSAAAFWNPSTRTSAAALCNLSNTAQGTNPALQLVRSILTCA